MSQVFLHGAGGGGSKHRVLTDPIFASNNYYNFTLTFKEKFLYKDIIGGSFTINLTSTSGKIVFGIEQQGNVVVFHGFVYEDGRVGSSFHYESTKTELTDYLFVRSDLGFGHSVKGTAVGALVL